MTYNLMLLLRAHNRHIKFWNNVRQPMNFGLWLYNWIKAHPTPQSRMTIRYVSILEG